MGRHVEGGTWFDQALINQSILSVLNGYGLGTDPHADHGARSLYQQRFFMTDTSSPQTVLTVRVLAYMAFKAPERGEELHGTIWSFMRW